MNLDDAITRAEKICARLMRGHDGERRAVYVGVTGEVRSLNVDAEQLPIRNLVGVYDRRITSAQLADDIRYWHQVLVADSRPA